jgi:spore germination cell wall hydrolase CwlJ-like protein
MKKFFVVLCGAVLISGAWAKQADTETQCLARNIYHEARGEPWHGKMAVAITTINRAKHWRFPNTICKVVYQPGQFQWTQNKQLRVTDKTAWNDSMLVALIAQEFAHEYARHFPALYFHNHTVRPRWHHRKLATIGRHTFYY